MTHSHPKDKNMTLKVFISYSSKDMSTVTQIAEELEALDIDVFVAEHSIKPGENLNDSIIKNIKESDMFVLLWGKNASTSDYVKQEIGVARGADKQIIPFVIDDGVALPEFIKDIKYIRAYENPANAFKDLCETVSGNVKIKVGSIILDSIAKPKVRIAPDNKPIIFKLSGALAKETCKILYPNLSNIDTVGEVNFIENQIIVGGNKVRGTVVTTSFKKSKMTQVDIDVLSSEGKSIVKQTLNYNDFRNVSEVIGKLVIEKVLTLQEETTLT